MFFDCCFLILWLLPGLRGEKTPTTNQNQTNKTLNNPPQNQNNSRSSWDVPACSVRKYYFGSASFKAERAMDLSSHMIKYFCQELLIIASFPSPRPFRPGTLNSRLQAQKQPCHRNSADANKPFFLLKRHLCVSHLGGV